MINYEVTYLYSKEDNFDKKLTNSYFENSIWTVFIKNNRYIVIN